MKTINILLPSVLLLASSCHNQVKVSENRKPNIIYILADDLGYGDLSCYGQKHFQTPNIDRLAKEGILFSQHYAGCTVSAPSRSSLMTGLTTGHTPIRGNKEVKPEGQWPLPAGTFTIAKMLKEAGYATGCFGKWGLGYPGSDGEPNKQGFEEFYGYNCQRLAHNYYPTHLWDNETKVILKGNSENKSEVYAPELIHQRSLQFIEKNKDKSFFMFYSTTIPHAELLLPKKYLNEYHGKLMPEKNFKGAKPGDPDYKDGAYGTQPECHAAFAAMVTLLDKQVGEIMDKLKKLGLDKNTIVLFSSDNGPHQEGGGDPDYFDSNGPLKGFKRDLYEGGIREPMIVRWPDKISAGTKTNLISAFWDVMPTLSDVAGIKTPEKIDGISFLPTLLGKGNQKQHDYLYWEFHELGGRKGIRKGDWKLVKYNIKNPKLAKVELYNLSNDIGEKNNVAASNSKIVKELSILMESARTESDQFNFESPTIIK